MTSNTALPQRCSLRATALPWSKHQLQRQTSSMHQTRQQRLAAFTALLRSQAEQMQQRLYPRAHLPRPNRQPPLLNSLHSWSRANGLPLSHQSRRQTLKQSPQAMASRQEIRWYPGGMMSRRMQETGLRHMPGTSTLAGEAACQLHGCCEARDHTLVTTDCAHRSTLSAAA